MVVTAVRVADGVLIVTTRSQAAGASRFVAQRKDALVRSGLRLINLSAAAGWIGAFGLFLWVYTPMLTRPRADGAAQSRASP